MRLSTFHTIQPQIAQPRRSVAPVSQPLHNAIVQTSVHFTGKSNAGKPEQTVERQSIVRTLFGTPIKNIGWAALYSAGGSTALFLMPPVGIALFTIGGLHLVAALWQLIQQRKATQTEQTDILEASTSAKSKPAARQSNISSQNRFAGQYTRPVSEAEDEYMEQLLMDLGMTDPHIAQSAKRQLQNLNLPADILAHCEKEYQAFNRKVLNQQQPSTNEVRALNNIVAYSKHWLVKQNSSDNIQAAFQAHSAALEDSEPPVNQSSMPSSIGNQFLFALMQAMPLVQPKGGNKA